MTQEVCLDLINISKRYKGAKNLALDDVSFSIVKGDKFGIIGPNGAGKTTLISIVCGLIDQSEGDFSYSFDQEKLSLNERKKRIGFVPQDFSFYEELSLEQNFNFFGAMYGLSKKSIKENSDELIDILGLKDVYKKKINTFSGGMKRRVNLAIGMLHKPSILFLDEPTVGVDVQSKYAIFRYLDQINSNGCTIIYTSHHLAEAEEFCSDIAIIDHGKLIASGKLNDLIINYDSPKLESLFIDLTGEDFRDRS